MSVAKLQEPGIWVVVMVLSVLLVFVFPLICSFCSLCSELILLCDKKEKHTVQHFLWEASRLISIPW